ncbi:carboxypeptidase regulatory-like domain-containing protein [Deinococcus sonorensis]|uniref:Carboxypeptidase regulatory-like domain-containing protein n=2 Tax=Deinococcus sonorensis TaxID=309891 RepID=A0AAU7UFN7_9DEIO
MKNTALLLLAVTALSACGASTTPATTPPAHQQPGTTPPASPAPGSASAYVMTGTVRTEAGAPIAGVQVFADHTAYYNMNALGTTDAQGHYRIPLAHQPGTWNAGAYMQLKVAGESYEVRLSPDLDTPFDGSQGAVRNFTFKASDAPSGKVNIYLAHSNVELDYDTLEYTFTPDGPNVLGDTAPITRKVVFGYGIKNVPIGRYKVSATQMLNGVKQQMRLRSVDQPEFVPSVLAQFHDDGDRYGVTMELYIANP